MTASAGKKKLKILFFSQRFPYPMDTGGKIRTGKLLEKLNEVFDITLISNVESPKDDKYLGQVKNLCAKFVPVPWQEVKKFSFRFYLKIFLNTFSLYPFTVINDYSKDLETKLLEVLEKDEHDLLVCDYLQPSLNFRKVNGYPTLLFQHNVESMITRRHFETAQNLISKAFWWLQWIKMDRYERMACQSFDGVVAVSEIDQEIFRKRFTVKNAYAIPTGIDTEYFTPSKDSTLRSSLVFTGAMDWLPNEDAILFFAREILGMILEQIPGVKLTVVGRNPSQRLLNELKSYPEIEVTGWVEDVRPYIGRHALYVIPLRIGGGTRIKVYEAMAMGKAVVSTTIGVEGLPVRDGENLIIADTAETFAQATINLLKDGKARKRIGIAARDFVRNNCGWGKAADVFADVCRKVASAAHAPEKNNVYSRSLDA